MTDRFKGLDLIDRVPEELRQTLQHCTGGGNQNHPQEKERRNGCLRRPYKELRKEEK